MKRFLVMFCLLALGAVPAYAKGKTSSKKRIVSASEVQSERTYSGQVGIASFYHKPQPTASGEWFDGKSMTAASRKYPLGSYVLVENLKNGIQVVLRITDRGPYVGKRIIDVAKVAAHKLDFVEQGLTRVKVTYLGRNPYRPFPVPMVYPELQKQEIVYAGE